MSTFASLNLPTNSTKIEQLGGGVVRDIAAKFDYRLKEITADSIGGLLSAVAPNKALLDNVAFARDTLASQGGIDIARGG
jgi:hypothetical protein